MSDAVFVFGTGIISFTGCALAFELIAPEVGSVKAKSMSYIMWAIMIALYCVGSYLTLKEFDKNKPCGDDSENSSSCGSSTIPPGCCGWESITIDQFDTLRNNFVYLFSAFMALNIVWCITAAAFSTNKLMKIISILIVILMGVAIGLQYAIIFHSTLWWYSLFLIPFTLMLLLEGLILPFFRVVKSKTSTHNTSHSHFH